MEELLEKEKARLNLLLNHELSNELLYRAFALRWSSMGWQGLADFFTTQAIDERTHHDKVASHMLDRGFDPVIHTQTMEPVTWHTAIECGEAFAKRERETTQLYADTLKMARRMESHHLEALCTWVLREQMEEEATTADFSRVAEAFSKMGPSGLCHMSVMLKKVMPDRELPQ